MKRIRIACVGIVLGMALSVPIAAWASHGKAGLWEVKIQNNLGQMPGMPDMSKVPPEVRARIEAMQRNGTTIRHCMTAADVANDRPNMSQNQYCKAINSKRIGQTFSVDLVCTGRMKGTGHVRFAFDSPEHYAGSETMNGIANGHPVNSVIKIDARWISPNCGKVHH